ncbi:MAG: 4Fe-4S dicluster domain-containing protein [Proteobacteria bacterium]|nr:4Fe-4S dicluster domain-containing protein [Pseudomonadota bacterium]
MKRLRIILAGLMFVACLALFLDFTGALSTYLGWVAKIQFMPAILSLNVFIFIGLILLTVIFGRIYCSVICPLGIFQDLFGALRGKKKTYKFWKATKAMRAVRYGALGLFAVLAIAGIMSVVSIFEPYSAFGRIATSILAPAYDGINNLFASIAETHESYTFYGVDVWLRGTASLILAIITFVGLAAAGVLTGRGYCTTVCPVGTLLGLLSKFSIFRVRIQADKCKNCHACERKCKSHCIDLSTHTVDPERCVSCFNCLSACKFDAIGYTPSLKDMLKTTSAKTSSETPDAPHNAEGAKPPKAQSDEKPENPAEADTPERTENAEKAHENAETSQKSDEKVQENASTRSDTPVEAQPNARRAFMATAATAAAGAALCPALALAKDGELAEVSRKSPYPRENVVTPPGSNGWLSLSKHCTGCQLCIRACHNKVLRMSDDAGQLLRPVLSFERGYCRPTCNDCSQVCPTGAIKPISIEQKSSTQIGRAIWRQDICLSAKGKHCRACGRACPNGAITFAVTQTAEGKKAKIPVVDLERCIGCGACEYVCPARPLAAIHVEGIMQHHEIS